jgi:hypothetical protein
MDTNKTNGKEIGRCIWSFGKGKRKRDVTVILTVAEDPISKEEFYRKIAKIITPTIIELHKKKMRERNQD